MQQEISWAAGERSLTCTVCGTKGLGTLIATIPHPSGENIDVVRCLECDSLYLLDDPLDFSGTRERIDTYVEKGAGLDSILGGVNLAFSPDVHRFLDVGCNVGFAMDMGKFFYGWDVLGIEPSSAGRFGATAFDLPILPEYLTAETVLPHAFDAVFASEVLEHVPTPLVFLTTMRTHLVPGGLLILTTPAAEIVDPSQPVVASLAAISAGRHCFVASQKALAALLERAGFVEITVSRDAGTLRASARSSATALAGNPATPTSAPAAPTATASAPPSMSPDDPPQIERYLRYRAEKSAPGSALECGMQSRLLSSLISRGAFSEASEALPHFHRSFTRRHGVDLTHPARVRLRSRRRHDALPFIAAPAYSLGMFELLHTRDYAQATAYFTLAHDALAALKDSGGFCGPDTASLLQLVPFHRALAQAHTVPWDVAQSLTASELTSEQQCRVFVEIVAQGFFDVPADALPLLGEAARRLLAERSETRRDAGMDTIFQLGIVATNRGNIDEAKARFRECVHAGRENSLPTPAMRRVVTAAQAQLALLPPPLPIHMIDTYWRDAWGVYVDGWIHLEDVEITAVHVDFDGVSTEAIRHRREDLAAHWPAFPQVVDGGFKAYVSGGHGKILRVTLTTSEGDVSATITLPDHPLPLQPEPDDESRYEDALAQWIARAPAGPVLAIGMRSVSAQQAAERLAIFGDREVVRVDIHPGFGVDVVGDAHLLSEFLPLNHFALVYSTSVLEHLTTPWIMALECSRVLAPGGLTIHRAPWMVPTHSQPNDFYRFSPGGLEQLFSAQFGFEIQDAGDMSGAVVIPSPRWRGRNERMATLTSASHSWVVARKVSEPDRDKLWLYNANAGGESARRYPLEGLIGEKS